MKISIDPTKLAKNEQAQHGDAEILNAFFKANPKIKYLPQGTLSPNQQAYKIILDEQEYEIELTKSLLWRGRKEQRQGDRWEVFNNTEPFAQTVADIFKSEGVLKIENEQLLFKQEIDRRLIKRQKIIGLKKSNDVKYAQERTKKEGEISSKVICLSFKPQTFQVMKLDNKHKHEEYAFSVMNLIKGKTLSKILEEIRNNPQQWSNERRMRLTLNLLTGLNELHAPPNTIIHRDIKPDNIIIGSDLSVTFIDYGQSTHQAVISEDELGTAGYAAYESMEPRKKIAIDEKSDLFSMGRIIGQVYGAKPQDINASTTNEKVKEAKQYKFDELFNNLKANESAEIIRFMLNKINQEIKDDRPTVADTLAVFRVIQKEQFTKREAELFLDFIKAPECNLKNISNVGMAALSYVKDQTNKIKPEAVNTSVTRHLEKGLNVAVKKQELLSILNAAKNRSETTIKHYEKKSPAGVTFFDRTKINNKESSQEKVEALSMLIKELESTVFDDKALRGYTNSLLNAKHTPGGITSTGSRTLSATEIVREKRGFFKSTLVSELQQFAKDYDASQSLEQSQKAMK